jgi:hypothetical protein
LIGGVDAEHLLDVVSREFCIGKRQDIVRSSYQLDETLVTGPQVFRVKQRSGFATRFT